MPEGVEDSSAGLVAAPPGCVEPTAEDAAPLAACCICMKADQVRGCLRSEKICILPILACLLSLALCTAGLKWVFVDKIFEYEPPTHLDPKRIGQDPVVVADPTLGLPHHETHPTAGPSAPHSPPTTQYAPTSALTLRTDPPQTSPKHKETQTPRQNPTVESNSVYGTTYSITSTTPSVRTSSHEKRCPESEEKFCVNGGTCFTLEVPPSNNKLFCRCPNEFTGDRCQNYVMASFYKHLGIEFMEAEELYQKQVLTITGICIALLVVGIMCVVAYCKTKKQRKKLHDRLRQSLRTDRNGNANMASVANGPHITSPPTEDIQLVNQYVTQSAPAEHTIEKETETSFSTSQYTSSANASTTVTQASNPSRNNGRPESIVLPESHTVPVPSSVENSRHSTPSRRGRLNGTGGARDLSAYLKNSRDTPESLKDSPYSERYVSAMTTPTRMSPVELLSPPSEVSAPLSSLATSVPSMSVSPQCEERPLLFSTPPRLRDHSHGRGDARHQRSSAHYNHGLEAHSAPPSPQRAPEDEEYETTQEYHVATQPAEPVAEGAGAKRTKTSSQATLNTDSSSESSSSESETEDERVGEDTPFLSIQNPLCASLETAAPFSPGDSSRTNAGLRLSPPEDLQARLSSVIANQDPIAV